MTAMRKHELISGPVGSGKSEAARERIEEDIAAANVQAWVIDYHGTAHLGVIDEVTRYAAGPDGAKSVLFEVLGHAYQRGERLAGLDIYDFTPGDRRHGYDLISLTIDDYEALRSSECDRALMRLLQMARKTGVRVRLVVPELYVLGPGPTREVMSRATQVRCGAAPAEKEFVTS